MTDKLEGIKPGDRVRVTFEGTLQESGLHNSQMTYMVLDGSEMPFAFLNKAFAASTFQIERIEPPLKAGDFVLADRTTWKIVDIRQPSGSVHQAAVWNYEDGFAIYNVSALERIE